jgi:ribA/ribD-fused uncharacterized protein
VADRNKIWASKSKLKNTKFFVNEDLPKETEKRRAQMYPILKKAKGMEKYKTKSYMQGDKLFVDKKKYTLENLNDLPHDLNPHITSTVTEGNCTFFFTKYSPLSNHYCGAPFQIGKFGYKCTEQRFFAQKAKLLGDRDSYWEIMAQKDPARILDLGKKIENLSGKEWSEVEYEEMLEANRYKFQQNAKARMALLETGSTNLAECSANNSKWGIGYGLDDPEKMKTTQWGTNFMGKILSVIRDELKPDAEDKTEKKEEENVEEEEEMYTEESKA